MSTFDSLTTIRTHGGRGLRVVINRPEVRNAFDAKTILELTDVFESLKQDRELRVLHLTGEGTVFCAGADLNWMREAADYDHETNLEDARRLGQLFQAFEDVPFLTLVTVRGVALGGGSGLTACADVALVDPAAKFGFTEVRLGIVPAVIAPFVASKVQAGALRRYFQTGEIFDGQEAVRIGLASECVESDQLEDRAEAIVQQQLSVAPKAALIAKELSRDVLAWSRTSARQKTEALIARVRATDEAREGLDAFLNKRPPSWRSKA